MGAVTFSIDPKLVEFLTDQIPSSVFIETGTFRGDTIALVKPYFPQIFSIECSEKYYQATASRFQNDFSVTILNGDSRIVLVDLVKQMNNAPILFWLDAHWCEDENAVGKSSQCPLLDELCAIHQLNEKSVILIDDARLFLCPPGKPHDYYQWPNFNEILVALNKLSTKHNIMIVNDVILYYPQQIKDELSCFAHKQGADWLETMVKSRNYNTLLKEVTAKEKVISDLQLTAEQRLQIISHQEKFLAAKGELLQSKNNELAAKDELLYSKSSELATKDELLRSKNNELAAKNELLKFQQSELAARDEMVQLQKGQLIAKEEIIQTQQKELIAKEEVIQMLAPFRYTSLHYWLVNRFLHPLQRYAARRQPRQLKKIILDRVKKIAAQYLPRVGQLYHHPPIPLQLPKQYYQSEQLAAAPTISIVTPSLNQAAFLESTLQSVLNQAYPNLEYIVQDGNSTDDTHLILEQYHSQLTHAESRRDNGQAHAINLGFARSTGQLMAWLNSDDLLLPGTLNYVANFFAQHPHVDVAYGHRVIIDENGQEIGRWVLPPHNEQILLWADYVPQETLFWRRRIWEKVGGNVDESYQFALDWELLLRFQTARAKVARLPRFLGAFRIHAAQKTSRQIDHLGADEMTRLREQYHNRSVSANEIGRNIASYLTWSRVYHALYRLRVLRY